MWLRRTGRMNRHRLFQAWSWDGLRLRGNLLRLCSQGRNCSGWHSLQNRRFPRNSRGRCGAGAGLRRQARRALQWRLLLLELLSAASSPAMPVAPAAPAFAVWRVG